MLDMLLSFWIEFLEILKLIGYLQKLYTGQNNR